MELIIGGAFQGKLNYVKNKYGFSPSDVCDCSLSDTDFASPCIYHFEHFSLKCAENGLDAISILEENLELMSNSVIICDDISCGVVPIDPVLRKWREVNGRMLEIISQKADTVTRVFCGIGQRLK